MFYLLRYHNYIAATTDFGMVSGESVAVWVKVFSVMAFLASESFRKNLHDFVIGWVDSLIHACYRPRMRKILMACSFVTLAAMAAPAAATDLCGGMLMPAAQLKTVSRGVAHGHTGVDLMAPYGSPIRAALGGTVIFTGTYFAYGSMIDIRHENGMVTRYGHLSKFAPGIRPGVAVETGALIGHIGTSGRASGAHLHFEVRVDGKVLDPKPYLGLAACPWAPSAPGRPIIEEARAPDSAPIRRDVRPK